ncbi:MAG: hypothetical protein SGILL_006723 [Bacillariaceae sp.]
MQQKLVDGTSKWFSLSLQKATDPISGSPVLNYSALDVSDIVQARKETRKAQFKSEFLSIIAHELRTPLHQVIGYADVLELDDLLSKSQRDTVQSIQQSSESLIGIINDLLDYSQIESSAASTSVKTTAFSMEELLQTCCQALETAATAKGLSLECVVEGNSDLSRAFPSQVKGDSGKLRQILLNLLENAVKYTPSGGIIVRAAIVKSNDTDNSHANAPRIRLEVQDTGIGVALDSQEAIFEKFRQGSSSDTVNTRQNGGIGLGLAICQGLTQIMGGSIGVESEGAGKGSMFWVELPLELPSSDSTNNSPSRKSVRASSDTLLKVLVVEDNEMNRKLVQRMLHKMGHSVYLAENGRKAVTFLEQNTAEIDLILMDIQMPVMDGIEATKYIRITLKKSRQELPIVGLTASYQVCDLQFYLDTGMNACLGKPVRLALLKQTLASVAGRCMLGMYAEADE